MKYSVNYQNTIYCIRFYLSSQLDSDYLKGRDQDQQFFESPTSPVMAASGSKQMHQELNECAVVPYFALNVNSKGTEEPGPVALGFPHSRVV